MAKKFTTKGFRLRAKAFRRRQALKVNAPLPSRKPTQAEQNYELINKLEAGLK